MDAHLPTPDLAAEDRLPADLLGALRRLPKAELHLHLDGSVRPATALALARERGIDLGPSVDVARVRLVAPMPCPDQARLLDAFDLPIAILQDAESLARVTEELVADIAADGTRYAEIRWAPGLHTARGLALRDGIAAVARGAAAGAAATGAVVRLIPVLLRTHGLPEARAVAEAAGWAAGSGVVALDLAGREAAAPDPVAFAPAFAIARAAGLGITCHAGEWGGAAQVRRALALDPDRIAHGAPAADDPALCAELTARGVPLDLCPTSNLQAGLVPTLAAHPLLRLHRAGVPVTLSTDDRTVSDLTLPREIARAIVHLGCTPTEVLELTRRALDAAFLAHEPAVRAGLRAELAAFAAAEPLFSGTAG